MKMSRGMVPQLPGEGHYKAMVKSIKEGKEATTKYGPSPTALVTFVTDNHSMVTQSFLMAPGVNFQLEKLAEVTIGLGETEEEVELDKIVGEKCGIEVEHRHVGNRVFANVVDVCDIYELVEEDELDGFDE